MSRLYLMLISVSLLGQTIVPERSLIDSVCVDQDDMCLWLHPIDLSLSTIITSDKGSNTILVYDLQGNTIQRLNVAGQPGNIDIRYHFELSDEFIDIVAFNDRTNSEIVIYKVNSVSRELQYLNSFPAGFWPIQLYGFCLYRNILTNRYYAFGSGYSSQIREWELIDNGNGTIGGIDLRTWVNGSGGPTEGMVCDDENNYLFASNELEGIYRYQAYSVDPNPMGTLIASVGEYGLEHDVEGITIYYSSNGGGYIIASSQGSSTFKVFNRENPHEYVKTFSVNGVGETDGIDISNLNLNSEFPNGVFLLHNGFTNPTEVMICDYADLDLAIDTDFWDPRDGDEADTSVNIYLDSFSAVQVSGGILFEWLTLSEIDNLGFNLFSSDKVNGDYNYINSEMIDGMGSSTVPHRYNYYDDELYLNSAVWFKLESIDFNGTRTITAPITLEMNDSFMIENNQLLTVNPNPFNNTTSIEYRIKYGSPAQIEIYNVQGRHVKSFSLQNQIGGILQLLWDGTNNSGQELPTGVYFCQLRDVKIYNTKKIVLLR
jgi:3-phytase